MNQIGPRAEHPLIGVTGFFTSNEGVPRVELRLAYADAIQRAGGTPLIIPPVGAERELRRVLTMVDGLVVSGGDDFDMERLGRGATHSAATKTPGFKQDLDLRLVELALEQGIPLLGICYGMQAMVLADPTSDLLQHLPDDRPGCQDHGGRTRHPVNVTPGSKLARLLGVERVDVISSHHQAIGEPGERWAATAHDDEGLIEAIEARFEHPFAVGVQWHPEAAPEGTPHDRLFRGLVGAAGMLAVRREFGSAPLQPTGQ